MLSYIKTKINIPEISNDLLLRVLFEMNRYFDSPFVDEIKKVQKENKIIFNSIDRKRMRKKYYFGKYFSSDCNYEITTISYSKTDIDFILGDVSDRIVKYDENKILSSIKQRVLSLNKETNKHQEWLSEYKKLNEKYEYSFLEFRLNQNIFSKNDYNENFIFDFITKTYLSLENYRHFAFVVDGEIYDKCNNNVTWDIISRISVFCENFVQFSEMLNQYKKTSKISELNNFLISRGIFDCEDIVSDFYKNISTGYKFEDCYISDNQNIKIIIFRKITLDRRNVLCPDCNTTIQNSNSFPEMFLQSWECKNPNCPSRSKSGRGKRFDAYSTYRNLQLEENNSHNIISNEFYKNWKRDIFDNSLDWHEMLIKQYTYANEFFYCYNDTFNNNYNRFFISCSNFNSDTLLNYVNNYDDLPIVVLLNKINEKILLNSNGNLLLNERLNIFNDNSTNGIQLLQKNQIGTVVTSPPYYNAREYSQWSNLICYLIDMMISCKAIFLSIKQNSYYLYNIGDIVSEDNVFVSSHTSRRRIPLGFLSHMIFNIVGYNLVGNIIWDKGEVQSKRNSTNNLHSGFIKCINCYEHFLVFRKGQYESFTNTVEKISPVIKINSKGENLAKHTAPYPIGLVNLSSKFCDTSSYILDPFLGSGTTLKWCKENNLLGIGYEINKEYYELCKKNIL